LLPKSLLFPGVLSGCPATVAAFRIEGGKINFVFENLGGKEA
jgi:hypothetical protein